MNIQAIYDRRSIRKYKNTPVSEKMIEQIVRADNRHHLRRIDNHGSALSLKMMQRKNC